MDSDHQNIEQRLKEISINKKWKVHIPPIEYTTDNAAMIGIVGYYKFLYKKFDKLNVTPSPRFLI